MVPPIVDVLDYLEENEFTAVHAGTCGSMGLVALLAARLLHLPLTGSVAGDLPHGFARYGSWFYGTMDEVFAPSHASARDLVARGLDPRRVRVPPAAPVDGPAAGADALAGIVLAGLDAPAPEPGRRYRGGLRRALSRPAGRGRR